MKLTFMEVVCFRMPPAAIHNAHVSAAAVPRQGYPTGVRHHFFSSSGVNAPGNVYLCKAATGKTRGKIEDEILTKLKAPEEAACKNNWE